MPVPVPRRRRGRALGVPLPSTTAALTVAAMPSETGETPIATAS